MTVINLEPYADGTFGQQGEASTDAEPDRSRRIVAAVRAVSQAGYRGLIWRELAADWNVHHGVASSALSNAHRNGHIVRLRNRRDKCGIYVTPENVGERDVVPHRTNRRPGPPKPDRAILTKVVDDWVEDLDATIDGLVDTILGYWE